jgi:DNA replication protein DnaC
MTAAKRVDDDLADLIARATEAAEARGWSPPPAAARGDSELERRFDRLMKWGVPYQEARYIVEPERLRETKALEFARFFVAQAERAPGKPGELVGGENILVLASESPGTGKTIASAWLLEHARPQMVFDRKFESDQHPRMIHASELAELAYRDAEAEIYALRRTQMLVIDDLGTERLDGKDIFQTFFGALLNARYGAPGFTAITTNLSTDDVTKRYGARVYDRLRERAAWFDISHGSLRGMKG